MKKAVKHNRRRYKKRNRIEKMFGKITGWQRIVPRCDRRATAFLAAIALAATVISSDWFGPRLN